MSRFAFVLCYYIAIGAAADPPAWRTWRGPRHANAIGRRASLSLSFFMGASSPLLLWKDSEARTVRALAWHCRLGETVHGNRCAAADQARIRKVRGRGEQFEGITKARKSGEKSKRKKKTYVGSDSDSACASTLHPCAFIPGHKSPRWPRGPGAFKARRRGRMGKEQKLETRSSREESPRAGGGAAEKNGKEEKEWFMRERKAIFWRESGAFPSLLPACVDAEIMRHTSPPLNNLYPGRRIRKDKQTQPSSRSLPVSWLAVKIHSVLHLPSGTWLQSKDVDNVPGPTLISYAPSNNSCGGVDLPNTAFIVFSNAVTAGLRVLNSPPADAT
ncbi:hypothetical protein FB451DRAFT_1172384 [Mycena latifolia]|nr:hypothetical protein FB451DRAFT_1172384 [Mycena latifolia]